MKRFKMKSGCLTVIILLTATIVFLPLKCCTNEKENSSTQSVSSNYDTYNVSTIIEDFANQHNLPADSYPDELIKLLEDNPETKDFVLNYPLKKDLSPKIDLNQYKNSTNVPLLLQWDERWGYNRYAGELMGLSGCGPTCLSMVCIYLLNDTEYTPAYIADFSERNGYSVPGDGSSWSLIPDGGEELGLDVTEIPLVENRIINNLEAGNPIICVMGPGDFTSTGHFIVMTEYTDGKIKVNDPNSKNRSQKLWELSDIKHQIRNLWVCRKQPTKN